MVKYEDSYYTTDIILQRLICQDIFPLYLSDLLCFAKIRCFFHISKKNRAESNIEQGVTTQEMSYSY